MKKKIILLALSLMLFATGVSASSLNGDYKGNPIVLVKSEGKILEVDEVPGQILDGHTMVPISLLRQIGASVTWDPNTYSVDVKMPVTSPTQYNDLAQTIIGFNKTAKQYNASNVKMIFNDLGGYISADLNLTGNSTTDSTNIMLTSSFVAKSPTVQIFINVYKNSILMGFYNIYRSNVEAFIDNTVSADAFIKTWEWNPSNSNTQPIPTSVSTTTSSTEKVKGPLKLYSPDGKKFLGDLTADKYGIDSVYNTYGTYGNKYGLDSIWNEYGDYGSKYSLTSAFNNYTITPPIILDGNGKICGYLTTNTTIKGGISPIGLYEFLKSEGY